MCEGSRLKKGPTWSPYQSHISNRRICGVCSLVEISERLGLKTAKTGCRNLVGTELAEVVIMKGS